VLYELFYSWVVLLLDLPREKQKLDGIPMKAILIVVCGVTGGRIAGARFYQPPIATTQFLWLLVLLWAILSTSSRRRRSENKGGRFFSGKPRVG
jgi:hypothetical protein